MALGNWVNTPSPANDSDAPAAVGNDGRISYTLDDEQVSFLLQSARCVASSDGARIVIEGEKYAGKPQCFLLASVDAAFQDSMKNQGKATLALLSSSPEGESRLWGEADGTFAKVSGGTMILTSITGDGPWEVDAELQAQTDHGPASGSLSAKIKL